MTHLSLFSGIGGLDIAAEWAGFHTVGQCEWADYPTKVLEKHWPDVPRWRDIRTLTGESFYERTELRTVDVISGGFPCQPFSVAGKRGGDKDDRYLWPEMLRVIEELRPTWVVGENVAGIVSMALDQVLSDLEAKGYAAGAVIIPACAVDAPHRRDRVAILAHAGCAMLSGRKLEAQRGKRPSCRKSASCGGYVANAYNRFSDAANHTLQAGWDAVSNGSGEYPTTGVMENPDSVGWSKPSFLCEQSGGTEFVSAGKVVAHTHTEGVQGRQETRNVDGEGPQPDKHPARCSDVGDATCELSHGDRKTWGGRPEPANSDWWPVEPDVGRVAHGIPARVDRLKCLGNAVVPQQFYPIFAVIAEVQSSR